MFLIASEGEGDLCGFRRLLRGFVIFEGGW